MAKDEQVVDKGVTEDARIGYRNKEGYITKKPTAWVTGALLDPKRYPTPTQLWFNDNYYVILPMGVARITDEARQVLLKLIGEKPEKDVVEEPVNPPVEPSTGIAFSPENTIVGTEKPETPKKGN